MSTSTVRSLSLGHASEMPRRRAVFVKVRSLNQDWRTGTLLIHLNLDIHKFSNVIRPYSKKFIGGKSFLRSFVFETILKVLNPMGVKSLS